MAASKVTEIKGQAPYMPMLKITPSQIVGYYQYCGERRKAWQTFKFGVDGVDKATGEEKKHNSSTQAN